jgi:hypothetical protein
MGSSMVPLPFGSVDVRASCHFDLVLPTSGVFFGLVFLTFLSWRGFLFFIDYIPNSFIVYFFAAHETTSWPFGFLFSDHFTHGWVVIKAHTKCNLVLFR